MVDEHKEQRVSIGIIRKNSKASAAWLLEGMSLAVLSRAIKQFEANDIVMYELVAKARLSQEANLMIRYLLSSEAESDASQAWGKALLYYIDRQNEIKYRQYKGRDIYNEVEKNFFNITSLWSHASYDNVRSSFMYTNKDPAVYEIDYIHDNSMHNNLQWIAYIQQYTEKSFIEVTKFLK